MKTTNKRIHGRLWHITMLHEPEDVDDVVEKYKLNPHWAAMLRLKFGTDIPNCLGVCFFSARWIIIVRSRTAGVTLAHEMGHAWAYLENGDKSESAADSAAARFVAPYKRYRPHVSRREEYTALEPV